MKRRLRVLNFEIRWLLCLRVYRFDKNQIIGLGIIELVIKLLEGLGSNENLDLGF